MSKNRFSELPNEVCEYKSLEYLNLYHNVMKCLPSNFSKLQSLTQLNLSRNLLSTVPLCVTELKSLRILDVSGNRLVSLPEEIGKLTNLMELNASYNQLAHLPPTLGDATMLRRLNLRRNLLQSLPVELCFLRLVLLDLSGNKITHLPTELRFMFTLGSLLLEANPLQHPPANVCIRGCVHIFKWLEMIATKEEKKKVPSQVDLRSRKSNQNITDLNTKCANLLISDNLMSIANSIDNELGTINLTETLSTYPEPCNPEPGGNEFSYMPNEANLIPYPPSTSIPTYRDYLETKRQQRAMESNNIYRRVAGDGSSPTTENVSGFHISENGSYSIQGPRLNPIGAPKSSCNGDESWFHHTERGNNVSENFKNDKACDESNSRIDVKSIQKEAVLSYVKSKVSPSKGSSPDTSFDSSDASSQASSSYNHYYNTMSSSSPYHNNINNKKVGVLHSPSRIQPEAPQSSSTPISNNNNINNTNIHSHNGLPLSSNNYSHPISPTYSNRLHNTSNVPLLDTTKSRKRSGGGKPFDPDSSPAHLNFTYRRELEKQQHERQLIENLRNVSIFF